jgi:hypothetical protein
MDANNATSAWKTYDDFAGDSRILLAEAGALLSGVLLAYVLRTRNRVDQSKKTGDATAVGSTSE